ncbi:hypothetical protein EYZ11_012255 [Aspergillus tanneri]|nr:hypothetical protein EYZ11_012255 [Aspergillus tanneri]
MRLQDIESLSPASKSATIRSIANDISSVFIRIYKLVDRGILSSKHTAPIDEVIQIITRVEGSHRRMLGRTIRRYQRRAKQWRREKRWMRRQFGEFVKRSDAMHGRWKKRVEKLNKELAYTKRVFKCDFLHTIAGNGNRRAVGEDKSVRTNETSVASDPLQ